MGIYDWVEHFVGDVGSQRDEFTGSRTAKEAIDRHASVSQFARLHTTSLQLPINSKLFSLFW